MLAFPANRVRPGNRLRIETHIHFILLFIL